MFDIPDNSFETVVNFIAFLNIKIFLPKYAQYPTKPQKLPKIGIYGKNSMTNEGNFSENL